MNASSWILALVAFGWGQDPHPDHPKTPTTSSTADVITFRDGKVLLGQVVETNDRRGPLVVLVRRAWAEANLADRTAAWEKAEAGQTKQAEHQRLERLRAWRRTRPAQVDQIDRITPWLDAEIARLTPAHADPTTPATRSDLMVVSLGRNTIKGLDRRSAQVGRLLRLAWTTHLPNPESMPVADLTQGLEDKGFSATSDNPIAVDALLPIPHETDEQWTIRRAATELASLPGGRFLLYGGTVMAEPAPGEAPPANAGMEALGSALKDLLSDGGAQKADPLQPKLHDLGNQGRVGAVVTTMEMAPDMSSTTALTVLWVNPGGNRNWVPEIKKASTVRPGDLPAGAGANLAEDPQVKAALNAVSALGLGEISPELKQRSLNMGFATQKALNDARTALRSELNALALPLELPKSTAPDPKP